MPETIRVEVSEYKKLIEESTVLNVVKNMLTHGEYVTKDDLKTIVGLTNVDKRCTSEGGIGDGRTAEESA